MSTNLCIPITASRMEEALGDMSKASELGDMIELRLDYIEDFDLERLLSQKKKPVIVTYRPERQGGRYVGPEERRIAVLQKACDLGADFVDVEYDCVEKLRKGGTRLIISYHNFDGIPGDLDDIYRRMAGSFADIVKVTVAVRNAVDNARIFDILKEKVKPTIALGMGEKGAPSRILAGKFGGLVTYGSLSEGKESAPGQISAKELVNFYRIREINPRTKLFGVVGKPVYHSVSPCLFNALFARRGFDGVYLFFEVDDVTEFISVMRRYDIGGFSVTIPHKQAALGAVDEADSLAMKSEAVNTIVGRGDRLLGFNTDIEAAVSSIEEALDDNLRGRKVLLIGAGGAARGIAVGLKEKGAEITILNRTVSRAQRLAERVGARWGGLESIGKLDYEILINSTSVGMKPHEDESPVPRRCLRKGTVVFDAVYTPVWTRLLKEAQGAGAKVVSGLEMFIRQAARQFELWTGRETPLELVREILKERFP